MHHLNVSYQNLPKMKRDKVYKRMSSRSSLRWCTALAKVKDSYLDALAQTEGYDSSYRRALSRGIHPGRQPATDGR